MYPHRPSYDPDRFVSLEDLSNRSTPAVPLDRSAFEPGNSAPWPFSNMSTYLVMSHLHNGNTQKSEAEMNKLVHGVIRHKDFKAEELSKFDAGRENMRLKDVASLSKLAADFQFEETSVEINVPSGSPDIPPGKFPVPGLLHRKLTSVIEAAFKDPMAHQYHYSPFKMYQRSGVAEQDQRVQTEVYNSDQFIKENDQVQFHSPVPPDEPQCAREKVVAAVMFASDSTHLANFGVAKAWPVYLMLGNLTKYVRAQPRSGALHHVAYVPSVGTSNPSTTDLVLTPFKSCLTRFKTGLKNSTTNGEPNGRTSSPTVAGS